jgi:phospholipase C
MTTDRRTFIQLLMSSAVSAAFPASISRALSIPANNRTGTIADVEHIVIMMQENRSFDHYFGTVRGVRGYGDPRTISLPDGNPVWYQPHGDSYLLPFHPGAPNLGLQFIEDLPHDWTSTHGAWNKGKYDQWVPNKGTTSMAHLVRSDIPFHYALADAFTICDAYHCSLLGPTDPNRYYMWTGWVGNDGSGGGPVVDNAEAGYDWSTYPELLQKAGVSWKIYQDIGLGLNAAEFWGFTNDAYIGNYGDNSLLYFHQYQNAQPGSPLANGAKTGTNISAGGTLFDIFRQDVASGNLPQISWVVAPEAYTEHPNWPANYGAWYDFTIKTESDPDFQRRLAGHLETGFDSMSDPAIGASKAQA